MFYNKLLGRVQEVEAKTFQIRKHDASLLMLSVSNWGKVSGTFFQSYVHLANIYEGEFTYLRMG